MSRIPTKTIINYAFLVFELEYRQYVSNLIDTMLQSLCISLPLIRRKIMLITPETITIILYLLQSKVPIKANGFEAYVMATAFEPVRLLGLLRQTGLPKKEWKMQSPLSAKTA